VTRGRAAGAVEVVAGEVAVGEAVVVDFTAVADGRGEVASMEVHGRVVTMPLARLRCRDQAAAVGHRFRGQAADDHHSVDFRRRALDQALVLAVDRSHAQVAAVALVADNLRARAAEADPAEVALRADRARVPARAAGRAGNSPAAGDHRSAILITS
jgi:hypothetical protein